MDAENKAGQIQHVLNEFMRTLDAIRNLSLGIMYGEGGYSVTQFLITFARNDARTKILRAFDFDSVRMADSAFQDARAALLSAYPESREDLDPNYPPRKQTCLCAHEQLHALRRALDGKDCMDEIVESLIAVRAGHNDINTDCLICPECRLLVSADKFKSGEWSA